MVTVFINKETAQVTLNIQETDTSSVIGGGSIYSVKMLRSTALETFKRPTGPLVKYGGVLGAKALSSLKAFTNLWLPTALLMILNKFLIIEINNVFLYLLLVDGSLDTLETIKHLLLVQCTRH